MKKIILSLFFIVAIALKEANGEIVRFDHEKDAGSIVFEINVLMDGVLHEFEINVNGKIISHEKEQVYSNQDKVNNHNIISAEEANEIALNRVGGGTIVHTELDIENGVQYYEIKIRFEDKEYDIIVNAKTKEITSFEEESI